VVRTNACKTVAPATIKAHIGAGPTEMFDAATAAAATATACCRFVGQYLTRAEASLGKLVDAGCVVSSYLLVFHLVCSFLCRRYNVTAWHQLAEPYTLRCNIA
jgi:hypothetical protein